MSQNALINNVDAAATGQLAGIIEVPIPVNVDMMPKTFGWNVLAVVAVLYVMFMIFKKIQHLYHNRYRKVALKQLAKLEVKVEQGNFSALKEMPELLKATAIYAFSRKKVAHLYAQEWELFLDASYDGPSFVKHCPGQLHKLGFHADDDQPNDYLQLLRMVKLWIKTHRGEHD